MATKKVEAYCKKELGKLGVRQEEFEMYVAKASKYYEELGVGTSYVTLYPSGKIILEWGC